mmetsp:Transcript_13659/g.47188  ORF Transcript_13659/g.47188 Transcript_13659/m.47188 type:complete len:220 (+) Transcript_13659:2226-2885(+)
MGVDSSIHAALCMSNLSHPSADASSSAVRSRTAPSSSGYHTPGSVSPSSSALAKAATEAPTHSLSFLCTYSPAVFCPSLSSTSTRIAHFSPTIASTALTAGSDTAATAAIAPWSSSTPFGSALAMATIAPFHSPGLVPNRAFTVLGPRASLVDATSGRLYRNTSRLPTPSPKSTTLRLLAAGSVLASPPSHTSHSSPHRRKLVARMVGPTPPLPAVKYE